MPGEVTGHPNINNLPLSIDRGRYIHGQQLCVLSFLINHQFGIFSVFFVGAYQNEIHVGGDSETPVSAKFTFQLISQIGRAIVQELNELSVGEPVLKIDVSANQRVELFHLRHTFDVQSIDFVNQLLFELGKLFPLRPDLCSASNSPTSGACLSYKRAPARG